MALAENVRRIRGEKGWTQKELADRCGISHPRISDIENGKSNPKLDTLVLLASKLGVTIDDLISAKVPA